MAIIPLTAYCQTVACLDSWKSKNSFPEIEKKDGVSLTSLLSTLSWLSLELQIGEFQQLTTVGNGCSHAAPSV